MKLNLQVSLTNISFSQQIQNVMSYNNISSERLYIYTHTHTHTLGIFNKLPNIIGDSRGKNRFLNDVYVCVCVCVCMICSFTCFEDCEQFYINTTSQFLVW